MNKSSQNVWLLNSCVKRVSQVKEPCSVSPDVSVHLGFITGMNQRPVQAPSCHGGGGGGGDIIAKETPPSLNNL